MSSISSLSGSSMLASYASTKVTQKAQTSSMVDELFKKLDTDQQGSLDKSELQKALSAASTDTTSSASADEMFSAMDADGDGNITKTELGDTLQSLMDKMDNLMASMRVRGAQGEAVDEGFTKDQLTEMSQDSNATDSKRASFMAEIAANFDAADSDGNGKVNREEAMTYAEANDLEGPAATAGGTAGPQGMGGPPPGGMPPPGGAGGASETESTASVDPADTDGDGSVSATEALEYLMTQLAAEDDDTEADKSTTSASSESTLGDELSRQILQLVKTYGLTSANDTSSHTQRLSASA